MKPRVLNESGVGAKLAVAALTIYTIAYLSGCGGLGAGDLGTIIGALDETEPGGNVGPGGPDTCLYRNDSECDDGRAGSITSLCPAGSDPEDCDGVGGNSDGDDCPFTNDGECDDGRTGSDTSICPFGTDSADCDTAGGGSTECLDNLDRFSGSYSLSVVSRELGVQNYSTEGEDICGPGEEFFGNLPTSATISVSGSNATISVNINAEWYSASGTFRGPSAPTKPLIGGTFYERNSSVTPGVNSCGTESPYFSDMRDFPEDGGQTTVTLWVYGQVDAINVVAEVFWIADDNNILSPCHGLIIFQGTR